MQLQDVPQRGKRGNTVSYRRGSCQISRQYVIPHDPHSEDQMECRSTMKQLRRLWGTLTDSQQLAWNLAAEDRHTARRLNQSGRFSGYLLFIQLNFNLATIGLSPVLAPPAVPSFGDNPVGDLLLAGSNGASRLLLSVLGQPAGQIIVLGAKPCSPGITYVDHFTILGTLPQSEGGVADITDMFVAKYGPLPAGSRIFIQTIQQINGWQDLPHRRSVRVPAP